MFERRHEPDLELDSQEKKKPREVLSWNERIEQALNNLQEIRRIINGNTKQNVQQTQTKMKSCLYIEIIGKSSNVSGW